MRMCRRLLLLVLAVLLPVRAAIGNAPMPCGMVGPDLPVAARVAAGHEPARPLCHDDAAMRMSASAPAQDAPVGTPGGPCTHHQGGPAGAACHLCSSCCTAFCVAGLVFLRPAPLSAPALAFAAAAVLLPSHITAGPERPPKRG